MIIVSSLQKHLITNKFILYQLKESIIIKTVGSFCFRERWLTALKTVKYTKKDYWLQLYVERSFVSIFVDMRVSLPPLPIWCVTVWLLATWLLMTLKGLFSTLVFTC